MAKSAKRLITCVAKREAYILGRMYAQRQSFGTINHTRNCTFACFGKIARNSR